MKYIITLDLISIFDSSQEFEFCSAKDKKLGNYFAR